MQSKLLGACALFMTILVIGCGSGGSSAVTATPTPDPLVTEPVGSLSAEFLNGIAVLESVPQPAASATADFQTAGTDTAFPMTDGDAIARSADGTDYAILFQRQSSIPAETSFVVTEEITWQNPRGVCGMASVGTCTGGVYTFPVGLGVPAGTAIGVIINDSGTPNDDTDDIVVYPGDSFSTLVNAQGDTDKIRAVDEPPIPARYHVWELETNDRTPNPLVASLVSEVRTVADANRATSGFDINDVLFVVKGARDASASGINLGGVDFPLAAFFIESQYSAIGWWMSNPDLFLDPAGTWGATSDNGVLHFGLATAEAGRPASGTATYSGVASGTYLRNQDASGEFAGTDRFIVGGVVTLAADFAGDAGVGGTVALTAYSLDHSTLTGDAANSEVDIVLTGGEIDGASFSGNGVSLDGMPTGAFADLAATGTPSADGMTEGPSLLSGIFSGLFTGTSAQEIVGQARLETAPAYTVMPAATVPPMMVARDTNGSALYIITETAQTLPMFTDADGTVIPVRIIPAREYIASGPTGGHPSPMQVLYMVPVDPTRPSSDFTQTQMVDILEFGFVTRDTAVSP